MLYFTCEKIEYNLITYAFPVDFSQPSSDFQQLLAVKSTNVGIHLLNWIVRGLLVIRLSRYTEFNTFLTPAPRTVVFDLEDHTDLHYSQTL